MDSPTSLEPTAESLAPAPAGRPPEDRKMRTIRYVFLFIMPFVMVSMMFASYVGTMHNPHPRNMPVAVVGTGAAAQSAVDALEATGGAVDARLVPTEGEARDLLAARDVAGAIMVPADGLGEATVLVAMAAGPSQSSTVQQILVPVAMENSWTVTTVDIAPLPAGDSSGTAVLFAAMGMMLAGYVPLSLMLMALPHLLAVRRFLPILAGWAAVTSSIIWLILGPVVGAVDGHYLQLLGVGMLAVMGVGITQLLFTKFMGPMAVLLGMALWVVLGMPSSNLALSVDVMPGFFSFLHGVLPLPAAGEALRSILYFDGQGVGRYLLTLALWVVVSLALCLVKERTSGQSLPGVPAEIDASTPLPALAGGPLRSMRVRYLAAAAFPMSILVLVVGVMSFSMHKPTVSDLPVAVVGSTIEQAEETAAGLEEAMGTMLDVQPMTSVEDATAAIRDWSVVAAFVLPQTADGDAVLYTSSAAGPSQQSVASAVFQQVAAGQQLTLVETDVVPLTDSDTMGSNSMYVGMAWIMAGFLMMSVLRGGAPELKRLRQFLPLLAGWAVGMSVWLWFLFDVIIGAVTGHAWEMIGFGAVTIFAVSLFAGLFTRTLGLAGIIPAMGVLMMAGVPSSGAGLSLYMVPEIFRQLNAYLPMPAAVEAVRSFVYFDGAGVGQNLLVIVIWGVSALLLHLVVDRGVARRDASLAAKAEAAARAERDLGASLPDDDDDAAAGADADRLQGAGVR